MSGIGVVVAVFILSALYFVPSIVAIARNHRNGVPIGLLNIFLGWTVLGWVIALIWAFTTNVEPPKMRQPRLAKCPECAELILPDAKRCKHCGVAITTPPVAICPSCSQKVNLKEKFCPSCGVNLH